MPAEYARKVREIMRSRKAIEDRLHEFAAETGTFLSGAVASVLLFDRDTDDFYLRTSTLRLSPASQVMHYSAHGTVEELALRERRVIALSESAGDQGVRQRAEMLFFPLFSSDEPLGVLVIHAVSDDGVPASRVEALADAAAQLSDTLGASLREESAALRMTKIAAINEAGINIISTLDLSRLLNLVTTSACLIMEAESCVVRLLDADSGKYGIREFYGMKSEGDQKDLFRLDKKVVTGIVRGAPSVLVRDLAEEEGWREFAGTARTLLCMPLRSGDEIIGTLTIFDKFPHKTFYPTAFNTDDLRTFDKFIRYVEKAIANAIAFERNERLRSLDESTALPTLKYFQGRLLHELARARRFKRRLVLMICEVSLQLPGKPFAPVDREEHALKRLAKVMRQTVREYDVIARISEWKFGMILPEAEDGKMSAIPRIKKAVLAEADEMRKRYPDLKVGVRFGHAAYPEDGADYEKLVFKSNVLKS